MKVRMLTLEFNNGPPLTMVVPDGSVRDGATVTGVILTEAIDAPDFSDDMVQSVIENGRPVLKPVRSR